MSKQTLLVILAFISITPLLSLIFQGNKTVESPIKKEVLSENAPNWREYDFPEVGLTFSAPHDSSVSGKMTSETVFELSVINEKSYIDTYRLHAIYDLAPKITDHYILRQELIEDTIEESEVSDTFLAITGKGKTGEKSITFILTDRGIFTLTTEAPLSQNKIITDLILDTMYL